MLNTCFAGFCKAYNSVHWDLLMQSLGGSGCHSLEGSGCQAQNAIGSFGQQILGSPHDCLSWWQSGVTQGATFDTSRGAKP